MSDKKTLSAFSISGTKNKSYFNRIGFAKKVKEGKALVLDLYATPVNGKVYVELEPREVNGTKEQA